MMENIKKIDLLGLTNFPLVKPGDNIASLIIESCKKSNIEIKDQDIFVITQKIISKSENRYRTLSNIKPRFRAKYFSWISGKDPRFVQLVLDESNQVLRAKKNTLIVEHKNGFICANAGIDHSNTDPQSENTEDAYLLLPKNPDFSADSIRKKIESESQKRIGVLIIDSHGRAWRNGTIGMAIGISGIPGLVDLRGYEDLFGFKLRITMVAAADELAGAASLLMGQAKEGIPVVIVRGFPYQLREGKISELIRPKKEDLFR